MQHPVSCDDSWRRRGRRSGGASGVGDACAGKGSVAPRRLPARWGAGSSSCRAPAGAVVVSARAPRCRWPRSGLAIGRSGLATILRRCRDDLRAATTRERSASLAEAKTLLEFACGLERSAIPVAREVAAARALLEIGGISLVLFGSCSATTVYRTLLFLCLCLISAEGCCLLWWCFGCCYVETALRIAGQVYSEANNSIELLHYPRHSVRAVVRTIVRD